jgi:tetratricopeptide (TPR) repeat protein
MREKRWIPVRARGCGVASQPAKFLAFPIAFAAWAALTSARAAEPYIPRSDDDVLETLPTALFSSRDELANLRGNWSRDPTNPSLASGAANRYMQLGSQTGDARFYGYARAALQAWWKAVDPPPEILRLRAKLKEKNHEYDQALADLHRLLERDPQDVQGWIEASNIYRVQGRYDQARKACDKLSEFAGPFAIALARIPILAVTGQAEMAYDQLAALLPEAREQYPSTVQWFLTMQAEVALALGRYEWAEDHLREALDLAPEDRYLLRAYGEFLLDCDRPDDSLSLVEGRATDDGLLLCAAIAAKQLGREAKAAKLTAELESRFDEVRQRGDQPLGRFEAQFTLVLKHDPQRALALALANWRVQKEAHDTQMVLEAALAAHDPAQAQPVLAFLAENHTQHAAIDKLVEQLGRRE